jgi:protein-S-isoprenylcysteine O-methyltransferase
MEIFTLAKKSKKGVPMLLNFSKLVMMVGILWGASEVLLLILTRSRKGSEDRDKGSLVWLNLVIYSCIAVAVTMGMLGIGRVKGLPAAVPLAGLVMLVLGILIRWTAIFTLRKYFTVNVVIQSGHKIIKSGIYRFVRHPSYSGALISFWGMGLIFSNWVSFVVMALPITIAFLKRIKLEERALTEAFGEEYEEYRKHSWHLFPLIY